MPMRFERFLTALLVVSALGLALSAGAADIGQIKVAKGQVSIERGGPDAARRGRARVLRPPMC